MSKLTNQAYWETVYEDSEAERIQDKKDLDYYLKLLVGENIASLIRPYDHYLLWDVLYKKYLSDSKNKTIIEIGSAPGQHLIKLNKEYGLLPFGVEYTDKGVAINRKNFELNNINPNNVLKADFFSEEFQNTYKETFDVVLSRGFIEHFGDVEKVIENHLNLLKKGGYLIITIPNLNGVYYWWTWLFNREQLSMHNLNIMQIKDFYKLFNNNTKLNILHCNYYGTFTFWLFTAKNRYIEKSIINFLRISQKILNCVFKVIFKEKGYESRIFSPNLIFIGVKR